MAKTAIRSQRPVKPTDPPPSGTVTTCDGDAVCRPIGSATSPKCVDALQGTALPAKAVKAACPVAAVRPSSATLRHRGRALLPPTHPVCIRQPVRKPRLRDVLHRRRFQVRTRSESVSGSGSCVGSRTDDQAVRLRRRLRLGWLPLHQRLHNVSLHRQQTRCNPGQLGLLKGIVPRQSSPPWRLARRPIDLAALLQPLPADCPAQHLAIFHHI